MLYRLPLRDSISRECCRGAQHTLSESKRLAAATEETSDVINDKRSAKVLKRERRFVVCVHTVGGETRTGHYGGYVGQTQTA